MIKRLNSYIMIWEVEVMKRHISIVVAVLVSMVLSSGCGLFIKKIPQGKIEIPCPNGADHMMKIGKVNFHYTEYAAPGQVVVMVHGFGSSTYSWQNVAPILQAKRYHVYAIDMKGFGWSDKPKASKEIKYDPITLMEEVRAWMDALKINNVIYVANSLGGAVGVLMAMEHPDYIDKMVLLDPAGYPHKKPMVIRLEAVPGAVGSMKMVLGKWVAKWNLKEVTYNKEWVSQEQIDNYYARLITQGSIDAQVSIIKTLDFDYFDPYLKRVPSIKQKTLLVWGEEDEWIPLSVGYRYRQNLPNSNLIIVKNCGHVPQEEIPTVTANLVLDFIGGKITNDMTIGPFTKENR
jgi:pimeloyl-ACP methyl ester carboxylesterase